MSHSAWLPAVVTLWVSPIQRQPAWLSQPHVAPTGGCRPRTIAFSAAEPMQTCLALAATHEVEHSSAVDGVSSTL